MRRRPTGNLKLRAILLLASLCAAAALPFSLLSQEDWFRTGTGLGVEKIRLAVPSFAARSGNVETPAGVFKLAIGSGLSVRNAVP